MGNRDNAFQRLLADEHLFVRFIRRYLRQHMPDAIDVENLTPEDVYREDTHLFLRNSPSVSRMFCTASGEGAPMCIFMC